MDHPNDVRDHHRDVMDHPVDVYPIVNDEGHVSHDEIVKLLRDEIGVRYASKSVSHFLFISTLHQATLATLNSFKRHLTTRLFK